MVAEPTNEGGQNWTPITPPMDCAPEGGQRSGCCFASLPDVLILELLWAQIAQRRMESAGVVDLLNEVGKVFSNVLEVLESHRVNRLDLQRLHEALGLGIVVWISPAAHRADQAMGFQRVAIDLGSVL